MKSLKEFKTAVLSKDQMNNVLGGAGGKTLYKVKGSGRPYSKKNSDTKADGVTKFVSGYKEGDADQKDV